MGCQLRSSWAGQPTADGGTDVGIWYWVAGAGLIALVMGGMSIYHRRLEDQGYWIPNSMRDVTFALAVILVLIWIALSKILEVVRD